MAGNVLTPIEEGHFLLHKCSIYDMLVLINSYENINFDEYIPVCMSESN